MEDIELTPDVTRQAEQAIRRPTARILTGCGILQLPAWGGPPSLSFSRFADRVKALQ